MSYGLRACRTELPTSEADLLSIDFQQLDWRRLLSISVLNRRLYRPRDFLELKSLKEYECMLLLSLGQSGREMSGARTRCDGHGNSERSPEFFGQALTLRTSFDAGRRPLSLIRNFSSGTTRTSRRVAPARGAQHNWGSYEKPWNSCQSWPGHCGRIARTLICRPTNCTSCVNACLRPRPNQKRGRYDEQRVIARTWPTNSSFR